MSAEMTFTAAARAADLTQRLLAFSRRQALEPKISDLKRIVADLEPMLRRTLGEHVEIELVRAGGLWQSWIDGTQLESAVLNLCINSRDAMPGGGRLTIETANVRLDDLYAAHHSDVVPGQYVMVAVTDTGEGMSLEVQKQIFQPFFTTKEVGKGTGLAGC